VTALFQLGTFTLNGGDIVPYKIECDALVDQDWATLAWLIAARLPGFGAVEGVPRGGLALARHLAPYATSGPLLVVDDVLTTGGSMEALRKDRDVIGAVVFAREPPPYWVMALFTMSAAAA
jgi:hypothetical protein